MPSALCVGLLLETLSEHTNVMKTEINHDIQHDCVAMVTSSAENEVKFEQMFTSFFSARLQYKKWQYGVFM